MSLSALTWMRLTLERAANLTTEEDGSAALSGPKVLLRDT